MIIDFYQIGINKASTFPGFCPKHDSSLINSIDNKPISLDDPEQLFLLAYRAATRELHVLMEAFCRIQALYEYQVSKELVPGDSPSQSSLEAVNYSLNSWNVWRHRYKFYDLNLIDERYNSIKHSIFTIFDCRPVIAASSYIYIGTDSLILNIIPHDQHSTLVIFSYPRQHSHHVRKFISPILKTNGAARNSELSRLLIGATENFFISPEKFEKWSDSKKTNIKKIYANFNDYSK